MCCKDSINIEVFVHNMIYFNQGQNVFKAAIQILVMSFLISTTTAIVFSKDTLVTPMELHWQGWAPQSIFKQALQQNRLVLLDLTASWCKFCKKMDEITYKDSNVIKLIKQHYTAVRADASNYPDLNKRYANETRPLTIIFDAQGKVLIKRRGYIKPQWMAWMLKAVIAEHLQSPPDGGENESKKISYQGK